MVQYQEDLERVSVRDREKKEGIPKSKSSHKQKSWWVSPSHHSHTLKQPSSKGGHHGVVKFQEWHGRHVKEDRLTHEWHQYKQKEVAVESPGSTGR